MHRDFICGLRGTVPVIGDARSESLLLGIAEARAQKSDMLEAVPLSLERHKFNPPLRSDLLPLYYKLDNK